MSYGPQLPPHLLKLRKSPNNAEDNTNSNNEEEDVYGPAIPPNAKLKTTDKSLTDKCSIGPQLPSNLSNLNDSCHNKNLSHSDSDEDLVGPLPPSADCNKKSARQEQIEIDLENRARQIKNNQIVIDSVEDAPKRESWMLDLPAEKAKNFGLGPRQFSKSIAPKPQLDRSWTDTPEIKAKRAALAASGQLHQDAQPDLKEDKDVLEYMASLKRDKEMENVANELKKKRGTDSLVEIHDKEKTKRRKNEIAAGHRSADERRPFDRDIDLQANRFDEAAKKAMLKNARKLNDKFSSGNHKYL